MVIFSLVASMAVILFLVSKKVNIGYSLMAGSVLLALLRGKGAVYIIKTFIFTLGESATILLAVTVTLITILGYMMEKYLILDRMILALEKVLRSAKATILIAPAIIGTLLVTGGALMSCPVVDNLGERLALTKDKRAAINMIFRHALYFIFPLSTTMILAAELGKYSVWDLIKLQLPLAGIMYLFGYVFFLRNCEEQDKEPFEAQVYLKGIIDFLLYASPILVSLLGVVMFALPFHVSLILGIFASILIHYYDKKQDPQHRQEEPLLKTIYRGIKPSMIIAIIGVMIFKNVVSDMQEIYEFLENLLSAGIPLEFIIFIACSMISFPLGNTQAGIAILYPMILPMATDYETTLHYAMFIYTSSFIFYYISPLHLCQVLTLEYFEVRMKDLYRNYLWILLLVYLAMLIIYFIHRV